MGYHVSIVNTKKNTGTKKILNNLNELEIVLEKFNFYRTSTNKDEIIFTNNENDDFTLFYKNCELLAITTNDQLIDKMVEISTFMNDGSRARGEQGETFKTSNEVYFHKDDTAMIDDSDPTGLWGRRWNEFGGFAIMIILSIVLYLTKKYMEF